MRMSEGTEPKRAVDAESAAETEPKAAEPQGKTIQLKVSTLALAAAAVVLIGALVTMTVLWSSARGELRDRDAQAADDKHAEQVATDYAVGVSTVNYTDFNAWIARLQKNTTPKLGAAFDAGKGELQKFMVPLQWISSPTPLGAQIVNRDNGAYKVNVYLNVNTSNTQRPDGFVSTVYYTVSVDPKDDWKVTEVSSIDLPLPKQ